MASKNKISFFFFYKCKGKGVMPKILVYYFFSYTFYLIQYKPNSFTTYIVSISSTEEIFFKFLLPIEYL